MPADDDAPTRQTLPERIAAVVAAWGGWSRAERANLDAITDEVIRHMSDGDGNRFVSAWCDRVLVPALSR